MVVLNHSVQRNLLNSVYLCASLYAFTHLELLHEAKHCDHNGGEFKSKSHVRDVSATVGWILEGWFCLEAGVSMGTPLPYADPNAAALSSMVSYGSGEGEDGDDRQRSWPLHRVIQQCWSQSRMVKKIAFDILWMRSVMSVEYDISYIYIYIVTCLLY